MKKHLKHIGINIRAARKRKTLSINTLSELIGISPSFLGTLERGESSLSVETLINVCNALDISADSIIFPQEYTTVLHPEDKISILLTLLKNSPDEEIAFLIDYVKMYKGRLNFHDV